MPHLVSLIRAKERTYPELVRSRRCHLTVLAIEVGGRWSQKAATFVRQLARCRARAMPLPSRAAYTSALALLWSALLSFAAARAFAAGILAMPLAGASNRMESIVRGPSSGAYSASHAGSATCLSCGRLIDWLPERV